MSYTVKIKEEISTKESTKSELIAELSGYIRNNGIIHKDKGKIPYSGDYEIYFLENYSFNEEEIADLNLTQINTRHFYSLKEKIGFTSILLLVSVIFLSVNPLFNSFSMLASTSTHNIK